MTASMQIKSINELILYPLNGPEFLEGAGDAQDLFIQLGDLLVGEDAALELHADGVVARCLADCALLMLLHVQKHCLVTEHLYSRSKKNDKIDKRESLSHTVAAREKQPAGNGGKR